MILDQFSPPARPTRGVAQQSKSLADLFLRRVEATPSRRAWRRKQGGRWVESRWSEVRDEASAVASR